MIQKLIQHVFDFFIPPICFTCNAKQKEGFHFCESCIQEIKRRQINQPEDILVEDKYVGLYALFILDEFTEKIIHQIKYQQRPFLIFDLIELHSTYESMFEKEYQWVPVPLHHSRKRERGYNQAAEIIRWLSKKYEKVSEAPILKRKRNTGTQTKLSKAKRAQNLNQAFLLDHHKDDDREVVLVDDVYTTGSTLKACHETLSSAKIDRSISYFTLFRAELK